MTREEALAVLGLAANASAEEIRAAHRRLIQRMHPDVGGRADLAARIKSKQETEQRLLKIQADRTGSLDQVLVAEREVARVREEIERIKSNIK